MSLEKVPSGEEMRRWVLISCLKLGREPHHCKYIFQKITDLLAALELPKSELERRYPKSGHLVIDTKASWKLSSLAKDGLLENTKFGYWQLTSKGIAAAKQAKQNKAQELKHIKTEQAVGELAQKVGVEPGAIKLLKRKGITEARLRQLLQDDVVSSKSVSVDHATHQKRMQSEADAIAHIQEKEPEWESMSGNNPGFDLCQRDQKGEIIKWCEVKSLSGRFSSVSLTDTEFREAQKRGPRYWLYIVENASSRNPRIIKINDPAGKAEIFTFGKNWRNVAEP